MFTVGTRSLVRKSFGKVTVLTKRVLLEFRKTPRNQTVVVGDSLYWSLNIDYYPDKPKVLVYRVKDYQWTKLEEEVTIGGTRADDVTGSQGRDVITSTSLTVEFFKLQASPRDAGQYVVLAAGNDLNRKSTFWVSTTDDVTTPTDGGYHGAADAASYLANDVTPDDLFDNTFDDVPTGFVEPKFAQELKNVTGGLGEQVRLTVVAYGSDTLRLSLYKKGEEEEHMLAGASPATNSNWLNLTYVIDNLQEYDTGIYKAVLSNGPITKTLEAWVNIDEERDGAERPLKIT